MHKICETLWKTFIRQDAWAWWKGQNKNEIAIALNWEWSWFQHATNFNKCYLMVAFRKAIALAFISAMP